MCSSDLAVLRCFYIGWLFISSVKPRAFKPTFKVNISVSGKVVETLEVGDVFGIGALIHPDQTRTSTAIAKTECQIVSLDREHFLFAVQETPLFALEVMKSFSDRLRNLRQL